MKKCYSRLLVDNHITDIEPEFMSKFSPEEYVRMVKLSGVESSMVYACDHNGNCYYPTAVGHQHRGTEGRDCFGDTVKLLRQENIVPIAYYTVIYHNDAAKRIPQARVRDVNGKDHDRRYLHVCPNNPDAVKFFKQQIAEIIAYPVDGLFIDMTFWPAVCCCDSCRRKFGKELPDVIDWNAPEWVMFQRFRENSMAEFAADLTAFARSLRPEMTVTHQFSPVLHGWFLGQSSGIAAASDYASGDFYGGKLQHRLAAKVFDAFSRCKPFEFMTSRCVDLHDHTSTKSDDELFMSALTTLANGGAYFFIDAIDPDGRLQEPFYRRLAGIQQRLTPFREVLKLTQAELTADVGVYFSIGNCVDENLNGAKLTALGESQANNMGIRHNQILDEVIGCAELLTSMHIPYRIIPEGCAGLNELKALVINNAAFLAPEECEFIRQFVLAGGTLIATGKTSLRDFNGNSSGNFALADVFGVDANAALSDTVTYFDDERILASGRAPLVTARATTEVRATLTEPYFPAGDTERYSSIHSNPPGRDTGHAALTVNRFGQGICVYCATSFIKERHHSQLTFGRKLFGEFLPRLLIHSQNLPGSTELTLLKSQTGREYLLTLVNYQDELPPIPLYDVKLTLRLPFRMARAHKVSDGTGITFRTEGENTIFTFSKIEAGEFLIIAPREGA
jgi:hypothetical protein